MSFAPRLFAVPTPAAAAAPAHPRRAPIAELRVEKLAELRSKKAIDRASRLLDRLDQRVALFQSQIAAIQKRIKRTEARFARIEDRAIAEMESAGLTHAAGFEIAFTLQPNPAKLLVENESLIPAAFMRSPKRPPDAPDKNAIKAALEKGASDTASAAEISLAQSIGGCRLVQTVKLVRK